MWCQIRSVVLKKLTETYNGVIQKGLKTSECCYVIYLIDLLNAWSRTSWRWNIYRVKWACKKIEICYSAFKDQIYVRKSPTEASGIKIVTLQSRKLFSDSIGGGFRVSKDSNYKFYIKTLIWLTIYVQTERFCITCYFSLTLLASSVLLKVFLTVLYFTNSLFKGVKCIKIEY